MNDPFAQFKAVQREAWSLFAPLEAITTPPAALLANYAGIKAEDKVLDVGCGTGVVAITAARKGARVKALDLSPALLERAGKNASVAEVKVDFTEGDAEQLPYKDGEFDVVVSQFGHMFAPRPDVTIGEMLRVLRPGGRIAFSTWPPELFTGRMFALVSRYLPPPEGVAPPPLWGDIKTIRERLGSRVKDLTHDRETMLAPALSTQHYRSHMETTAGPIIKLLQNLENDPAKVKAFRSEFDQLITEYLRDNVVRMSFLLTRATKV
jgi:SAM-dependent methyltransferase